jgi:hypothetical protein
MQGLPRDLSLSSETELLQQFVPELKRLRLGPPITIHSAAAAAPGAPAPAEPLTRLPPGSYSTRSIGSGDGGDWPPVAALDSMGPRVEITCAFTIAAGHLPSRPFGISVLRSPGGSERTDLAVDMARGYVMIDGTKQHTAVRAGPLLLLPPPPPASAAYTGATTTATAPGTAGGGTGSKRGDQNGATSATDKNGSTTTNTTVWMHAIIDACVIEVIWNNRTALTTQVHPSAETSTGIALFGVVWGAAARGGGGGGGVSAQCTAWRLALANNTN